VRALGHSPAAGATPRTFAGKSKVRAQYGWLVALALVACGSPQASESSGQATGSTCPSDAQPTYQTFGSSFMQRYCTRCHAASRSSSERQGAPSDHNFDTLDGLRMTDAAHIDEQAAAGPDAENTAMPPNAPKPTSDERRKLGEWLACGMP
jgi:uncharacterized membrane protein